MIKQWLKNRQNRKQAIDELDAMLEKQRLCRPCGVFCGDSLCRKVGCLNTDMRSNAIRLKLLVARLEKSGYVFDHEGFCSDEPVKPNVYYLDDYR